MRYGHVVISLFCAWVLWQQADTFLQDSGVITSSFEVIGAEEARAACLVWADRAVSRFCLRLLGLRSSQF